MWNVFYKYLKRKVACALLSCCVWYLWRMICVGISCRYCTIVQNNTANDGYPIQGTLLHTSSYIIHKFLTKRRMQYHRSKRIPPNSTPANVKWCVYIVIYFCCGIRILGWFFGPSEYVYFECVWVCVCECLWVWVCMCVCECVWVFVSVCVSVCEVVCEFWLCVCVIMSVWVCVFVCACVCVCLYIFRYM